MFKPNKSTTTIDFGLDSVFFISLEHFSDPTPVLLLIVWKGKCWLKVCREQNNTVMLIYTHNHAPKVWRCCCEGVLAIEMKNKIPIQKSFFKYDANLTSVITVELILFSLRCSLLPMTSLAVTSSKFKASVKFRGTSLSSGYAP